MPAYTKTQYEVPDTLDGFGVMQPSATVAKLNKGEEGIRLAQAAADTANASIAALPATADAATGTKGLTRLSTAPASASVPIAVGDNDPRLALGAPNTQTGSTYTFVLADATKVVEGNSASAQTFTIPANSTGVAPVAYAVGTEIVVRQYGAGQITIAAGAGVTLRARGGAYKLAGQYAETTLTKRAADEWVMSGDTVT